MFLGSVPAIVAYLNALAYYTDGLITAVKSFIVQTPEVSANL